MGEGPFARTRPTVALAEVGLRAGVGGSRLAEAASGYSEETARYGCDMSEHGDVARNGGPAKRSESAGRKKPSSPKPATSEPKRDYERTLEALRASPNCRRIITSGPTLVWMLSSPAQLAVAV